MVSALLTTIDGVGRLVVPKARRDQLQLRAGQSVELTVRDGRLEAEPAATSMRLVDGRAVPDCPLPALTAAQVRATSEQTRR